MATGLGGNVYETYGRTVQVRYGAALFVPCGCLAFPAVLPLTSPDAEADTPEPKSKKKAAKAPPTLAALPYIVASIPNVEWMKDLSPNIQAAINEWNSEHMAKLATKRLWSPRVEWFTTFFDKLVT